MNADEDMGTLPLDTPAEVQGGRRKNFTPETRAVLLRWLVDNYQIPYPTAEEKKSPRRTN